MKKITKFTLLCVFALIVGCNDSSKLIYGDVEIFRIERKSLSTEDISPEYQNWPICKTAQSSTDANFVNSYILSLGEFNAYVQRTSPLETAVCYDQVCYEHSCPLIGNSNFLTDEQLMAKTTSIDYFAIYLYPIKDELELVKETYYGNSKEKFLAIAEQNRDDEYYGVNWYDSETNFSYIPTAAIDVVVLQDYDETHPAGSSINDILTIDYFSAEPFILSGYKNTWLADRCNHAANHSFKTALAEFNTMEANIIEDLSFSIQLTTAPTNEGLYNFQLTYSDISGETRTATTNYIKIAAK